jgi:hypothetical protein
MPDALSLRVIAIVRSRPGCAGITFNRDQRNDE